MARSVGTRGRRTGDPRPGLFAAPAAALLAASLLPSAARAEPLRYRLGTDLPLTVASGAIWSGLYLADVPPTATEPGARPGGLDGLAPIHLDASAVTASDVLLYGSLAGSGLLTTALAGRGARATAFGLWAESFAFTGAVTEITKRAVDRPRPYVYGDGPGEDYDDYQSFFSGHASFVGASTVAMARTLDLLREPSPAARVALYGGAAALTTATGLTRVLAGKHFPSDVLVGGLVGGSIGFLVPELHRMPGVGVSVAPWGGGLSAGVSGQVR